MDAKDIGTQPLYSSFLPIQTDACVGTDLSRRLLSSNDWFYSKLFRQLLAQTYAKHKVRIS